MKILLLVLALALVGVTGALVSELRHREPSPAGRVEAGGAQPVATNVLPNPMAQPALDTNKNAQPPPRSAVHQQVRQAIETDVAALKSEPEVDRYLEDLMARARHNRRVTALEMEPGIAAIEELALKIGPEASQAKLRAFSEKMAKLSAEFDGRDLSKLPGNAAAAH